MKSERRVILLKAAKLAAKILWWSVTALLVLLLVSILAAKLKGKVPSVFGYSVINIVSGSMEDTIPRGSYILIKKTKAENVAPNDIICFYSSDPKIYGMPNTHRVIRVEKTGDAYRFVTRGDANPIEDKNLAEGDRLIGVYVKRMDALTKFTEMISGNFMIIAIICLQIGLISMFVYTFVITKKAKESEEKAKEIAEPKEAEEPKETEKTEEKEGE